MKSISRGSADGLEKVFHERSRLALLTTLLMLDGKATFNQLKEKSGLTDGNLMSHLRALAGQDVIDMRREQPRRGHAVTVVEITSSGRRRFLKYLDLLERMVAEVRAIQGESGGISPAEG